MALGGGHGLATTLRAVQRYAGRVTAVVSVADDGGSSGRLRQIAGIPAPGDLRRCLVAMAAPDSPWAEAFEYRFPSGDLEGHALGNLIIAGLANVTGRLRPGPGPGGRAAGDAAGRVLPATTGPGGAEGRRGRHRGGGPGQRVRVRRGPSRRCRSSPPTRPCPAEVLAALAEADQVVIGPGSLFTSVLAVCVVPDIRAALAARSGGRVYVCNLRPQLPRPPVSPTADLLAGGPRSRRDGDVMVPPGDLARPDGSGHDPEQLAAVLRLLT